MKKWFQDLTTAVSFLTVLPVQVSHAQEFALARSMLFFPLLGFSIGLLALGVTHLPGSFFPERFADLLLILIPLLFSGGLHLDGFADCCDGFFGGRTREETLRIMKDPALGVWGVTGVIFLILVKWELLGMLPMKPKLFLLAMTASRWAQVFLCRFHADARPERSLAGEVARKVGNREFLGASIFLLAVSFWVSALSGIILGGVLVFLWIAGWYVEKRLGGITGDVIGAASEITEILVFFLGVLVLR